MTKTKGNKRSKGTVRATVREPAPRKARRDGSAAGTTPRTAPLPAKTEPLNPDLRRMIARYLREDMVAVLTVCDRPSEPSLKPQELPAAPVVFPLTTRVALSDQVVRTWKDMEAATDHDDGRTMEITDGARWMSKSLLFGANALLLATAELVESKDLRAYGGNTLTAIGNLFSTAFRRELLLAALEFYSWNMPRVSDDLRLGGTSHVLRAIKDLGLEKELAHARAAGLVRRGRPKSQPQK